MGTKSGWPYLSTPNVLITCWASGARIRRSKVAPELPTIAESGYPGFDVRSWYSLLVTAGTPAAIVDRIHEAVVRVMGMPEIQEAMARQGLEPEISTPKELAARIKRETAVWAEVIRETGIKVE